MDKELEEFKQKFIEGYIDRYIDRLLDLRNIIKNSTTYEEITKALDREKEAIQGVVSELDGHQTS